MENIKTIIEFDIDKLKNEIIQCHLVVHNLKYNKPTRAYYQGMLDVLKEQLCHLCSYIDYLDR